MTGHGLDLAVIGNGRTAALVDPTARGSCGGAIRVSTAIRSSAACWPASEEKGFSDVVLDDMAEFQSEYVRNTAIVSTRADRPPRRQGPDHRLRAALPPVRPRVPAAAALIASSSRSPACRASPSGCGPTSDYGKPLTQRSLGSNHIRYSGEATVIRLTTDAPLSLIDERGAVRAHPAAAPGVRPGRAVPGRSVSRPAANSPSARATTGWNGCAACRSRYDWQEAIIRAAITLKLCNFEETGAIIAAHTTSIPEAPGSGRTWDYRYCWLRDAYFVVQALNRIGATRTMEEFISFTLSIVSKPDQELRPLYSVVPTTHVEERTAPGSRRLSRRRPGAGRQRRGRPGAARHLRQRHSRRHADVLRPPPAAARRRGAVPAAGNARRPRRQARRSSRTPASGNTAGGSASIPIRRRCAGRAASGSRPSPCGLASRSARSTGMPSPSRSTPRCSTGAWNEKRGAFTAAFGSDDLDASVLLLPELGVVEVDDPRFVSTVAAMERELVREKHVMRYASADDFGLPETAFLICRFWLIDALWSLGRREAARDLFTDALAHRNRYGLLSEDVDPQTGELWGNFPQTYSMAGLILSAMRLSRSWEDRYWRG